MIADNQQRIRYIFFATLVFFILVRLFVMVTFPLTDTTEARYANIALIMAMSNDWITPYFDIGVPFWGKPPLSFWAAAISYDIFGVHDVTPRIPSLIFSLMTGWLVFYYLATFYAKNTAYLGVLIYFSTILVFLLSGTVLTDPFLTFATTLSMVSFMMVVQGQKGYWNTLFFVGLGIGLLTKGPLVFVLVGGALTLWLMLDMKRVHLLQAFSWVKGLLTMALIALPWYVFAELKTPGFIDYFIIGEHFKRFVDSGWSGDLYGTAHKEAKGYIWVIWVGAALPFSFVVLGIMGKRLMSKTKALQVVRLLRQNQEVSYFVAWSMFAMIFFTISANVLATYVLPTLPALAILLAIYVAQHDYKIKLGSLNILYPLILFTPVLFLIVGVYFMQHEETLPTEKGLIAYYQSHHEDEAPLYYIGSRPFSAQYYSANAAILVERRVTKQKHSKTVSWQAFMTKIKADHGIVYMSVVSNKVQSLPKHMLAKMKPVFKSKDYTLFKYVSVEELESRSLTDL